MNDPEIIYLQPACCADPSVGRVWCKDDVFTAECEHGVKPAKYVRADLISAGKVLAAFFREHESGESGSFGKPEEYKAAQLFEAINGKG